MNTFMLKLKQIVKSDEYELALTGKGFKSMLNNAQIPGFDVEDEEGNEESKE